MPSAAFSARSSRHVAGTFAAFLLAPIASAGNVLTVGSGQTYAQITTALAAAQPGDLILVDPGFYAPFTIDGASVSDVSVVASGFQFSITPTSGVPEITVTNVSAGHTVTVIGAYIDYADLSAPAVLVTGNSGAVRFSGLDVNQDDDLLGTSARACVEVVETDTFWLIDSSIWSTVQWFAWTSNPLVASGITNDGVSALLLEDSSGIVQNSRLNGYHNDAGLGGATGYGGDGVRAIGENTSLWLLEDHETPGYSGFFRGRNGLYGGHAVHQVRSEFLSSRIRSCGGPDNSLSLTMAPGQEWTAGPGEDGGFYGWNNTNNSIQIGSLVTFKVVKHCTEQEQRNETTLVSNVVPIGGDIEVRVRSRLDRDYLVLFSLATDYVFPVPGLSGRGMAGFAFDSVAGQSDAQTVETITLAVPLFTSLIGNQLTVQGVFGPVGGSYGNLGLPALAVLGPP